MKTKDETVPVRRSAWIELHRAQRAIVTHDQAGFVAVDFDAADRLRELFDAVNAVFADTGIPTDAKRQPTLFDA